MPRNPLPETVKRANRADEQLADADSDSSDEFDQRPALETLTLEHPDANALCLAEAGHDGAAWIEADANAVVDLYEVA
ncbi:hypothetical protein [Natronorubrum sp. DTA7]|uniref:hypothetical protein n=1 Tax=Natronorubrum sp. DTA7 TaxID=3447016 RepID=UPI003F869716